jgi:hypothetical protein
MSQEIMMLLLDLFLHPEWSPCQRNAVLDLHLSMSMVLTPRTNAKVAIKSLHVTQTPHLHTVESRIRHVCLEI